MVSQMKVRSALYAGSPLPPGRFLILISVKGCRSQGHIAAGRTRSVEKSGDLIGNRTANFWHIAVLQLTMLLCGPQVYIYHLKGREEDFNFNFEK
jgi:hypothetical protein